MTHRFTASTITDAQLDELYDNLARLRTAKRTVERVEALAYRWETALPGDKPYACSLRAALAGPKQPATDGDQ